MLLFINLTGNPASNGEGKILYPCKVVNRKGNLKAHKCHITPWLAVQHCCVGKKKSWKKKIPVNSPYSECLWKELKIFSKRSHIHCMHLSYVTEKWFILVKLFVQICQQDEWFYLSAILKQLVLHILKPINIAMPLCRKSTSLLAIICQWSRKWLYGRAYNVLQSIEIKPNNVFFMHW